MIQKSASLLFLICLSFPLVLHAEESKKPAILEEIENPLVKETVKEKQEHHSGPVAMEIKEVRSYEVRKALDGKIDMKIIDVRPWEDYQKSHIKHAISLPVEQLNAKLLKSILPNKNYMVVFYTSDSDSSESATAAIRAIGLGYTKVYNYTAGFEEWEARKFPVKNMED